MFGLILSISFSLYVYVYILARSSFLYQSQNLIELGKNLGFSKFKSFYSIILPAARPAIVAGLSLVAMETLAEFGAVDFFSVNTLTTGIYNAWIAFDDLAFANRISFFLLLFIFILFLTENLSRKKARYHLDAKGGFKKKEKIKLYGSKSFFAFSFCFILFFKIFALKKKKNKINIKKQRQKKKKKTQSILVALLNPLINVSNIKILKKNIDVNFLSGGTDLSLIVTKERKDINSIVYMNSIKELQYIKNNNKYIEVGASTPLIEFESYIKKYYPDFTKILKRYGSPQIRNVATIAGNIATASPIGDCLPLLLSLNAKIVLQDFKKTKIFFLDNFFINYRKTKLRRGQFIHSIRIPLLKDNTFKAYKVSKRFDDDISSVWSAFNLEIVSNKIRSVRVAYGGMAAIPKRATYCEKMLLNSHVTAETIDKAKKALERDFKPISDMRASRLYRMKVAKNLLEKCCAEINQKKLIGIYV